MLLNEIAAEVIDELADRFSVGEKVRAITAKAMAGELDFADSLRRRVELLEGMESIDLEQVASKIPLAEGAESLFKTLNHLGYKTAIISGGFTFFGNQLKEKLGIDMIIFTISKLVLHLVYQANVKRIKQIIKKLLLVDEGPKPLFYRKQIKPLKVSKKNGFTCCELQLVC